MGDKKKTESLAEVLSEPMKGTEYDPAVMAKEGDDSPGSEITEESNEQDDFDFDRIFQHSEDTDDEVLAESEEPKAQKSKETEETAEEPGSKPEKATEPEPVKVEEKVVSQEEPKQKVESEPVKQELPQTEEPVDLNAAYADFFNKSVEGLEQTVYSLTPEQKETLDSNPSEIIPRLAATLHMQVLSSTMKMLDNILPQMIPMINEKESLAASREKEFFDAFPKLKGHEREVERFAKSYVAANPQANAEEVIQHVGVMSMVALKIPFENQETTSQVREETPKPLIPSSAGNRASAPAVDMEPNVWEKVFTEEI